MHRRGIRVLPGGDYGFAWTPHGTYARDLAHFVELLGFTPMEAIVSATRPLLQRLFYAPALNLDQAIYVADGLKTGRVMAKDEDVCLHCGLCAERCPTGAWDMNKFYLEMTYAGPACR